MIYHICQDLFFRFARAHITPHDLRHIFRTHVKNLGVTLQEEESVAYWMKHDKDTANKVYTHQDLENRMVPAMKLMQRINSL